MNATLICNSFILYGCIVWSINPPPTHSDKYTHIYNITLIISLWQKHHNTCFPTIEYKNRWDRFEKQLVICLIGKQICYRNWYQDWGHCCVTNDLGSSPQPEGEARGRSPRAVVSFPGRWWRNNDRNGGINFYSIMMKQNQLQINKRMQGKCSKLPQNCLSYSMVTCAQLAIVQWSHVTWLFLPGNTCSNHCDVKTKFVTLNFSHTLHKNNWQNTHYNSW